MFQDTPRATVREFIGQAFCIHLLKTMEHVFVLVSAVTASRPVRVYTHLQETNPLAHWLYRQRVLTRYLAELTRTFRGAGA